MSKKKDFSSVIKFDNLPPVEPQFVPPQEPQAHFVDSLQISRPKIRTVDIDKIKPSPNQPRKTFEEDALRELGETIKEKGLLQEIGVIPLDDGSYELIYGERRLRACKYIGMKEINARIFDPHSDIDEITLIENIQREELKPEEEAISIRRIMKKKQYTQERMAEVIGKSRSNIAKYISIADFLDDDEVSLIVAQIRTAKLHLTFEILYMASSIKPKLQGVELLRNTLNGKMTVRNAREMQKSRGDAPLTGKQAISKLAGLRSRFDFSFLKSDFHGVSHHERLVNEIDQTLSAIEIAANDLKVIRQSLSGKK